MAANTQPNTHTMSAIDALEVRAILRAVRDSDLRIIDPSSARMVERAIELMAPPTQSDRFWDAVHVQASAPAPAIVVSR